MEKAELLAEFQTQLELWDKYQGFIDKARSYSDRFNPAVVEKVIADNTARCGEVSDVLDPLVPDIRGVIGGLEAEKNDIDSDTGESRTAVEELELRLAIGEIDQDQFDEQAGERKSAVDLAGERVAELELELEIMRATLGRWLEVRPAGEDSTLLGEEEEDVAVELDDEDDDGEEDLVFGEVEDAAAAGAGVHAETNLHVADDLSVVFDEEPVEIDELIAGPEEDDEEILEADDEDGGTAGGGHEGISFSASDLEVMAEEESEPDMIAVVEEGEEGEEGRSAVLILQEGTDEEHVYPFGGDVLSLGRGRDNNIQVKNDSKVSRYHCKLFRRAGDFFIEDNKSANGTLVNGELITERRLFGGEEVIIGETFFRFRINP